MQAQAAVSSSPPRHRRNPVLDTIKLRTFLRMDWPGWCSKSAGALGKTAFFCNTPLSWLVPLLQQTQLHVPSAFPEISLLRLDPHVGLGQAQRPEVFWQRRVPWRRHVLSQGPDKHLDQPHMSRPLSWRQPWRQLIPRFALGCQMAPDVDWHRKTDDVQTASHSLLRCRP